MADKQEKAEVLTVVHKQDKPALDALDLVPSGVLVVDDAVYQKVARLGNFFDPRVEASNYRPPLNIANLKGDAKENVAKALAEGGKN